MKEARASFIRLLSSTVFTASFEIKLFSSLLLSSASFNTVKTAIFFSNQAAFILLSSVNIGHASQPPESGRVSLAKASRRDGGNYSNIEYIKGINFRVHKFSRVLIFAGTNFRELAHCTFLGD